MKQPERTFPPYYEEHRDRYWNPGVIRVGDLPVWVLHNLDHWAVNSILIEAPDGLVVFDTGISHEHGQAIATEIRKLSDKPVRAIVYSHHHADHCQGTDAIVDPAAVESGEVAVIAWHTWAQDYATENQMLGPIMGLRALYQYGAALPPEEKPATGLGGRFIGGTVRRLVPPTMLIDRETDLDLAGLPVTLFPTGGEAAGEIAMHLPGHRLAIIADEVYAAMPNLFTMRGARFRDSLRWAGAGDRVLDLDVEHLVGTHMLPISGREEIRRVLTTYGDAIRYTHDQAVRLILGGATPLELRTALTELPPHLDIEPYTRPMYGTVAGNAAQQFVGYLGWFGGDATDLAPTHPRERARRTVALMGGREDVLAEAVRAVNGGDPQWGAELASLAVAMDHDDMEARGVKAAALRAVGYAELNPLRRNWYLTAAMELEGTLAVEQVAAAIALIMSRRPAAASLDALRFRVDPELAGTLHVVVGVRVTDTGRDFSLELRNSVLLVEEGADDRATATLAASEEVLGRLCGGVSSLADLLGSDEAAVDGDDVHAFFAALDLSVPPVSLHVR